MIDFVPNNLPGKLKNTFLYLEKRFNKKIPKTLITLGSGQSEVLNNLKVLEDIPFSTISGIPKSSVSGHKGNLEIAEFNGNIIAIMRGRLHTYETNRTLDEVVRIQKALCLLGIENAILTNASGATSLDYKPGELVLINDHINLTGMSPLISNELLSYYFLDQSMPYDALISEKIIEAGKINNMTLKTGTYTWMKGPQYETPSETRMVNILGGDIVGMSTVPEVIILNYFKVKVAAISIVTNYAGGIIKNKVLTHDEIKEVGLSGSNNLNKILETTLKLIYSESGNVKNKL